jgi:HPt (histidine-containing phosphotransfer) domain-containing protein
MLSAVELRNLWILVGGDAAAMRELIDAYFEEAPRLLADMRAGLEAGDAARLQRAAHSLKSNSADFGLSRLAQRCKELEAQARAKRLEGAEDGLAQAEREYQQGRAALEALSRELDAWAPP